jgi:signal transduction histidine kinase
VDDALEHVERANAALRDLVRGILPAALSRGGLQAGIESLVEDLPLPVELHLRVPRLPPAIETAAYFVVAEALTNVVKHSGATRAEVSAVIADERLLIDVEDDGCGGADARRGSGLVGLFDRVEAREGKLTITSLPGQGTRVSASLPLTLPS